MMTFQQVWDLAKQSNDRYPKSSQSVSQAYAYTTTTYSRGWFAFESQAYYIDTGELVSILLIQGSL